MGLFSTIAHELRGPLQAVALSLELLADTVHDAAQESRHLDRQVAAMRRQTVWLQELLENMLFADRLLRDRVQMQRQLVDLSSLIDEVRSVVDPLLAHRAQELRVSLAPNLPLVPADPRRLGQVLINLLVNAAKYGPAATRIDVQATVQAAPAGEQGAEGPRVTRITVADRGPGVPVSERAHVFTPFYRGAASSAAPGVGLGLGIVYAIVHAHGGRVGVRNRPGGGAAF
jgi:two-component system sensor histidine kinase KdpD